MCGNCTPFTMDSQSLDKKDYLKINYSITKEDIPLEMEDPFADGPMELSSLIQDNPQASNNIHNDEKTFNAHRHVRKRLDVTPIPNDVSGNEQDEHRKKVEEILAELFEDLPSPSASFNSTDTEDSVFSVQDLLPTSPTMATTPAPATTPRQPKGSSTHRAAAVDNKAIIEMPLDYSFMNIGDFTDLEIEEPRAQPGKKIHRNQDEKFNCKCLKMNNNVIAEMKGFTPLLDKLLVDPAALSWVDLSFNELTKIDPVFCDYPNLQILYLHGNQIGDIKEVDKLSGMRSLKKLCLHGNPIETTKNYRWYVLSQVPQLNSFDMSGVTKADRATAIAWKTNNPTKKKKSRSHDD